MNFFSFPLFFASIMCIVTGAVVYHFNRKAKINLLFSIAAILGAYWAFTEAMMWQSSTAESAFFWGKAAFLWPFFAALATHFAITFTESKLDKTKYVFLILYLPALFISIITLFTGLQYTYPVKEYWGYYLPYNNSWFTFFAAIWSGGISIFAALLCVKYCFKATEKVKKLQARCIAIGLSIPVCAYAITNIIFPLSNISVPNLGNISVGGFIGIIAYAMWKYDLFNLDPYATAENIISTMPDSLVLANIKGQILRVNKSTLNFLKYPESEIIGKSITELFLNKNDGLSILTDLSAKREINNLETKFRTKSGEEKTVTFSGSIVRSKRGIDIGITCIVHDITYRKSMEEKLVAAERFASIGELAGMVGHDLRNPLTSIRGAAYYLKSKYSDEMSTTEKEMFKTIESSIDYSNKIISDLLDYSKNIKLELEAVTPKIVLSSAFSLVQKPSNILVNSLVEDAPEFKVDVGKLDRVFTNIIKNAFDSMPNGGTLTITSRKIGDNVEICFCDTGEGMTHETLSKLWTPLFTTKAKGMGFGLPICKRIVEAHGGTISAKSTIKKGTAITLALPINFTNTIPLGV